MVPYEIAVAVVAAISVLSGTAAALMVTFGVQGKGSTRRMVIERLTQIAFAGAGVLFALLAKFAS